MVWTFSERGYSGNIALRSWAKSGLGNDFTVAGWWSLNRVRRSEHELFNAVSRDVHWARRDRVGGQVHGELGA